MSKNKKSILIIGTGSLLNYGCEAIVLGTYEIIKRYLPEYALYLASDNLDYDKTILPSDINIISYKRRFTLYRIWKGILRRFLHIGNGSVVHMNYNIGKRFDIVLSCGGDNFCEAPGGNLYTLLEDLIQVGNVAYRHNRKYILWGASIGPFHNPKNYQKVINNLQKADAICVRENLSFQYLIQEVTLKNKVQLIADPAFCMKPDFKINFEKKPQNIYIGLNLSLLSIGHTIEEVQRADFINQLFINLDNILTNNPNYAFVCIPHVVIEDMPAQNDNIILKMYQQASKYPDRILRLPDSIGSAKTKGYIAQMDALIATRMHCCVGGISTAVPTLFVTYSNKGSGMSFYAYHHHKYEVAVPELATNKFIEILNTIMKDRQEIHQFLKSRTKEFEQDSMRGGAILKNIAES